MTCIKTGADVYLAEHGAYVHGDLFQVGETYILACGGSVEDCMNYAQSSSGRYHLRVSHFEDCGSCTIAMQAAHCSDFSYDGWKV